MLAAALLCPSTSLGVWYQSAFVIGGYGTGGDANSLIRLNAAGIDVVVPSEHPAPAQARRFASRLDSLRRARSATFHLKQFVYAEDGTPSTLFKNSDPVRHRQAIVAALSPASGLNDSSVAGWLIWDEPPIYYQPRLTLPSAQIFNSIHEMTRVIRDSTTGSHTQNKLALVNMLPIHSYEWLQAPCSPDTIAAYRCLLDQYLSTFDSDPLPAPVLCFDKYPFEFPRADYHLYFVQLATMRDKAAQYSRPNYHIPFWSVVQSSPRRENAAAPYHPTPTFNQIRWQVYVSLAYGAKGIFYWTLRPLPSPPPPKGPSYGASFVREDGSANGALYDSLSALNGELRRLGPTLMKLDPVSVHHAAAHSFRLPSGERDSLVVGVAGRGDQGMAGWFKPRVGAAAYVMVVNKDTLATDSYTITLAKAPAAVYRVDKRTGRLRSVPITGASFRTGAILPGSGELYKLTLKL